MNKLLVALVVTVFSFPVYAEESFFSWLLSVKRKNEVAPAVDAVYDKECGSCHFPYQPGLLPERSWKKVMAAKSLEDHFGDNAELGEETRSHIEALLLANAADKSYYKRSKKIMVSLKEDEAPMRITEVRFFKKKHHELEDKHVKNNDKVKSLSYCNKCHQRAKDAVFDDDTVVIPKFGRWTW